MTSVVYMEIGTTNVSSGSYEVSGRSNREDAFLIGDKVETLMFPPNTLEAALTVTFAND